MKLSLFWKLMLSFALVVAVGLGAVILLASQITNRELHQFMMGNGAGSGMMGRGAATMEALTLERINGAVIAGGLAALAVALMIGYVVFRGITRPVEQLTGAARALSQGNLSARVEPAQTYRLGDDELTDLANAFNAMADHLQQTERLRRDMTADIAHELRTPLSVMRGNLEAMLDGVYPADAEHLRPVLNQVHLLSRLIEDLRTLALAEAGQLPLEKHPTDPGELIHSRLASFEAQSAAQGVSLRADVPAGLPAVSLDPDRIGQTLAILLTNALRYTPTGGSIAVAARLEEGSVHIEVADTGAGIPPEDLPRIFERFYRADKSRSRAGGGSGLGLAIAKGIVEAHGGSIAATSAPGDGTHITIRLPVTGDHSHK